MSMVGKGIRSPFAFAIVSPLLLLLLLGALALALASPSGLERDWLPLTTEHLVVHFWRDGADPGLFERVAGESLYLMVLRERALHLERAFQRVEEFLGLDYDPGEFGRAYVFVYPDLESYQEATGCLICAASVGGFLPSLWNEQLEELVRAGEVSPIVVYLTLDSTEYVALHEFTHLLDFALIRSSPPAALLEGLATYVGYRLDPIPDEWQLGLGEELLRIFMEEQGQGLDLREYLTLRGYWKFTYEVGASFVAFLVERAGLERFLEFYSELHRLSEVEIDGLLRDHFGEGLAALEAEWKERLAGLSPSENVRALYEFRMDQVLVRYIFLRPLFREPERAEKLFEEARTLRRGRFDEAAGAALRRYLSLENLTIDPERAAKALDYSRYLLWYVRSYHRTEPELLSRFHRDYRRMVKLYAAGDWQGFLELYFRMVQTYVTWR